MITVGAQKHCKSDEGEPRREDWASPVSYIQQRSWCEKEAGSAGRKARVMYHRKYNFPAVCTGSSPGAAVHLGSGFAKCLLAVLPPAVFQKIHPKGADSGAEGHFPHSGSKQGTDASSEQKYLNINIYISLAALDCEIWKAKCQSRVLSRTQVLSSMQRHL